ncbi:MAG: DUF4080 domain-containing protein [Eubacterium sp.]|nr:DUF4080 domain-containing protein [Eubacterium sp.]
MKILLTTLNSKYIHTNLAIRYLKKCIERDVRNRDDINVEVQEFTINNSEDYIYNEIIAGEHDIVCFSCYIWNIEKTLHLCENLKKALPEIKILLGGPEVSYDGDQLMEKYEFIDYILAGEGEKLLPEVLLKITDENPPRQLWRATPVSVEDIPFPYEDAEENKIIYYESTRGCPYNCSYCMSSIDKKVRPLPIDRVKDELNFFLEKKVKQVKFLDRTFNWNKERSYEIFQYLIENDNGLTNFHFEICAENMTEETIDLIGTARKDLFQFEIGIQSTCQETLKSVDRLSDVDLLLGKIEKLIALRNCHIHVDLIAGLPFENLERFKKSFDDVYNLGADALQLGFLKLLKGTKIRKEEENYGFVYDEKAPYQIIKNDFLSAKDLNLLKRVENVLDEFYNKGGFENSLKALVEHFPGAFDMYEAFAKFYYENGYQKASHKKEDNYRILNKFAVEVVMDSSLTQVIYADMEKRLNFDAVKKFNRKGWEI